MVGVELMAQRCTKESFYEEVITKGQFTEKRDINCNIEVEESDVYTLMHGKPAETANMPNDEDFQDDENIYEIIPGDCAAQNCAQCPMLRSFSFGGVHRSKESIKKKTELQQDSLVAKESSSALSSPLASHSSPDLGSTQYAEIIHTNKVSDFVPSRPTRDSENPILRQDFSGNLSFLPNLRDLRKHLTEVSQERCLEREQRSTKATPSTTPECPRKPGEKIIDQHLSKSISPTHSPRQSPRAKNSPGPIYVNMEFPLTENGDNHSRSRRTSASSSSSLSFNERQSLSSTEDAVFRDVDVSPYENLKDTLDCARPREGSEPVDIVYSDLHFHDARRSKSKLKKTTSTPSGSWPDKLKVEERSRSLPVPGQSSPRLPPGNNQNNNLLSDPRPKSNSLGRLSGGALGFYVARFVKSTTVQRSNAKTLQTTIHDIVSKTKVEDCLSVNVEVTSDMMRISTNCPPWEVIASFDIENIGCIDLYEHDPTTLGVIVCVPETEAECYVVCCPDAQLIFSAAKNAFNSSTSKTFKIPVSTPVGPESWLGEEDITTFTGISYLGSFKVKKTYLLINESITSLLEKAHPKEFKNIYLEVHPGEIRLIDARDNKILHQHAIPWILLLGAYEQDTRLFGYIVSEAPQGEKTRMFCHVFRCGRITSSVAATEAIRLGCQATYSVRRDSVRSTRRISFVSDCFSECQGSSSSPPLDTSDSLVDEHKEKPKEAKQEKPKTKGKVPGKRSGQLKLKRFSSMPHLIRSTSKKDKELKTQHNTNKPHPNNMRTASVSSVSTDDVIDSSWEIVEEETDYNFDVTYLCSTVINPPLRPKHLRECVKQFLKQQAKSVKKFGMVQPSSEVVLTLSLDGVKMTSPREKGAQGMFFPFSSVSNAMAHPENPEYFAFATIVTGDSKHKCHLFEQTKIPPAELIEKFQAFM